MKIKIVTCSGCGEKMDCPESMVHADKHFCEICVSLLTESVKKEELKDVVRSMRESGIIDATEFADSAAGELTDIEFKQLWKEDKKFLSEVPKPDLAEEMFYQGARTVLQTLVTMGFNKENLKNILELFKTLKTDEKKLIEKFFKEKIVCKKEDNDIKYVG